MATTQYIGARYVPLFYTNPDDSSNNWKSGVSYDPLTVVTDLNQSYTSKIPVPATVGRPSENPTHWILTGAYSAQVEQYRQEVLTYKSETETQISELESATETQISALESEFNTSFNNLNTASFKNAKTLFLGDSFMYGWNGTAQVTKPSDICAANLGIEDFDMIGNRGSGFVSLGNPEATYPSENFIQLLEHVRTNNYDVIVVLGGSNDINYASDTSVLATAVHEFWQRVREYWPGIACYFIPAYTNRLIERTRRPYASTLYRNSIRNGVNTCRESIRWFTFRDSYAGNDNYHLNNAAYIMLGSYMAAFMCGWDGKLRDYVFEWSSASGASRGGMLPVVNTELFNGAPTWSMVLNDDTITLQLVGTLASNLTEGQLYNLFRGVPAASMPYQMIPTISVRTDAHEPYVLPAADNDIIAISGLTNALIGGSIRIQGSYKINLNYSNVNNFD